jgi:hypothetical protein
MKTKKKSSKAPSKVFADLVSKAAKMAEENTEEQLFAQLGHACALESAKERERLAARKYYEAVNADASPRTIIRLETQYEEAVNEVNELEKAK